MLKLHEPFKGVISDEISEQHQHQTIQNRTTFSAQIASFGANKVLNKCTFSCV